MERRYGATLNFGSGMAYEYTLGPDMAAAKSAVGYDPNIIKLAGNSWVAPNQGYGGFGWVHNVLTVAKGHAQRVAGLRRGCARTR